MAQNIFNSLGNLYPNTELSVDLKLLTRRPGRMKIGEQLPGTLSHDNEDHFIFTQDTSVKKNAPTRHPHAYEGQYINVTLHADGSLYPTFCRPTYTEKFTFLDLCRGAAEELLMVARVFDQSGPVKEGDGR